MGGPDPTFVWMTASENFNDGNFVVGPLQCIFIPDPLAGTRIEIELKRRAEVHD